MSIYMNYELEIMVSFKVRARFVPILPRCVLRAELEAVIAIPVFDDLYTVTHVQHNKSLREDYSQPTELI